MATSVNAAFAEFLRETVNLDPTESQGARTSRDWLRKQLGLFDEKHDDFPLHYSEKDVDYGSFARKTKIRELDDVDMIHCLVGEGASYLDDGRRVTITTAPGSRLSKFNFDGSDLLSSIRVLNKLKKHLNEIPQYRNSETRRNSQAITLELASYTWNFDIVPGFFTQPEYDGRTYYIIPDGDGNWMKTDPRLDRDRVSNVNQKHDGYVLNSLRLAKYWNRRHTAPSVPSYAFESMLLSYFETTYDTVGQFVDLNCINMLFYIATSIYSVIADPKRIQGDLNSLDYASRLRVSERANEDAQKGLEAWQLEQAGDHKGAINKWREIFGPAFPRFE